MVRKYEPLAAHLIGQSADEATMSFAEVEVLVGELPRSCS